jgi:hypothetical protein
MANPANISRRAAIVGALFSSAALAVPSAAATRPVFVRVGSPELPGSRGPAADPDFVAVPRETYELIQKWLVADREERRLREAVEVLPPSRRHEINPSEDAAMRAHFEAHDAMSDMFRALRAI